jgi:uncharacterized DUF497 family protein
LAGGLSFDWDEANKSHIAAHAVTPSEVEQAYANDPMDLDFRIVDGEDRYTILGHTNRFRVLVVALTVREGAIRPVTAFDASRSMAREYLTNRGYQDA